MTTEMLSLDGARLAYEEQGSGAPIVLVHGAATGPAAWGSVPGMLAQEHRVIRYDRRGFPRSGGSPTADARRHVADLAAVLERVVRTPATLFGWSSGGNLALALAAQRPDLVWSVVVLEAPFHGLRRPWNGLVPALLGAKIRQARGRRREAAAHFFRWVSTRRSGGNSFDDAPAEVRGDLLNCADAMLAELNPHPSGILMHHVRAGDVAACPVPLTWLLAEDSGPWYAQLHADMQRRRPTLRTVRIERAGHFAVLDRPRAVADAVREAVADSPQAVRPARGHR
ncbi:alpha/beta hydrolase [Blastococcus sp. MG754426]|uniref:alpha/beta fold hydrolase n=1 Tax=unclassified Blastococcus TaxID=2619396 RepID=UPI001EF0F23A|nr:MULTISPECIES: alpha/beta hydrolase [unclassified Blastococcus]MCF6506318.1 alpha/beta hydrolase [Blastococcus sp. MG754426]MCF6510866.1 alpha/beta hydrolase [Blastococcus sp. MG754427]